MTKMWSRVVKNQEHMMCDVSYYMKSYKYQKTRFNLYFLHERSLVQTTYKTMIKTYTDHFMNYDLYTFRKFVMK